MLSGQISRSTKNYMSTAFSSNVYLGDLVLFLMVYIQTLLLEWYFVLFSLLSLNSVYVDYCIYESMWLISKTLMFILLKLRVSFEIGGVFCFCIFFSLNCGHSNVSST